MPYPADPPRAEEIILVMRQAGQDRHGLRIRALIAVLWRGGLRISEAVALNETDVDPRRGSLIVRRGKGDKRREAGMDAFGFEQLAAWLAHRVLLPPGPLFCVIDGATRGRRWAATAARAELRQLAVDARPPTISATAGLALEPHHTERHSRSCAEHRPGEPALELSSALTVAQPECDSQRIAARTATEQKHWWSPADVVAGMGRAYSGDADSERGG